MATEQEIQAAYIKWVIEQAKLVGSDGCTVVADIYLPCCYEHDLGYHYGKDPRQAFRYGWDRAAFISRGEVDKRFRECIQAGSPVGKWSPVSYIRWLGVRIGGWWAWKH